MSGPNRGRRQSDNFTIRWRENWYRDLWLLVISAITLYAAVRVVEVADQGARTQRDVHQTARDVRQTDRVTRDTQKRVVAGRRFAVSATCAVASATAEAGRNVILAAAAPHTETPFVKRLEALGYPPLSVRRAEAQHEADAYNSFIRDRLLRDVGARGKGLVNADGSLNCRVFRERANAR